MSFEIVLVLMLLVGAVFLHSTEWLPTHLINLSASLSFIAPPEPACLLVFGPGKYRFLDLLRVGAPLTAAVLVVLILLVPIFWPL